MTSALGSTSTAHGFEEQDSKRKALNDFIRTSGTFDGVIDFDKVVLDPLSGGLKSEFVPDSTSGGPGDKLHPNRSGYLTMGEASISICSSRAARRQRLGDSGIKDAFPASKSSSCFCLGRDQLFCECQVP